MGSGHWLMSLWLGMGMRLRLGQVLPLIHTFILRCVCVCVCVNIFFNYGQAALNPEQFPVGPYNWHYKSHFTLICERKKKRNKEMEREAEEAEAQSESCGRFTNCWLVAGAGAGAAAVGGNWKWKSSQPTERLPQLTTPPSHTPPPPLPGSKIYSEKYILQFSTDFGPQGAALATLDCWQRRGTQGGWGRQAVCVTLSDSLKREESAIEERGWGGVQTKHSTRFWQN